MPRTSLSLFTCLWGSRKQAVTEHPCKQQQLVEPSVALWEQPSAAHCSKQPSEYSRHCHRDKEYDGHALLQFQRLLSDLRGTWLAKTHAALSSVSVFLDLTEASFFSAPGPGKTGGPTGFVLLARESFDVVKTCKEGQQGLGPGFEVWPGNEGIKGDAHAGCDVSGAAAATTAGLQRRTVCQQLLPEMLARMLATQAPVIHAIPSDSSAGPMAGGQAADGAGKVQDSCVAALVPLTVGDRIAGALWLVRCGPSMMTSGEVPLPASASSSRVTNTICGMARTAVAGEGGRIGGGGGVGVGGGSGIIDSLGGGSAGTTSAVALLGSSGLPPKSPSHKLLQSEAAAAAIPQPRQCPALLSSPQGLQQLGISVSMCLLAPEMQYLGPLCENVYALSGAGSMQLLISGLCDALASHIRERFLLEPRVFAALVRDPDSPVGLMFNVSPAAALALSRSATKFPRTAASVGGGGGIATLGCSAATEASPSASGADGRRVFGGPGTSQSPRVMAAGGVAALKEAHHAALGGRSKSESRSGPVTMATAVDRDGGMDVAQPSARATRVPALHRVVALTQADFVAPVDVGTVGGGGGGGATAAGGLGGSSSFGALRVKPFPLAQTLLRHTIRRSTAASSIPTSGGAGNGSYCTGCRAYAVEVEDCAMHMQDPKKPSRDILLLITNSGTGAGTAGAAFGGLCGGGSAMSSLGSSFTSGRRPVSSLLLLVVPIAEGRTMLGLYVTFPQPLPMPLLRQARCNLQEILEVLSPVVSRKLTTDLSLEMETLVTAPPGSYAVVETADGDEADSAAAAKGGRTAGGCTSCAPASGLEGCTHAKLLLTQDTTEQTTEHMMPICNPLVQSFLYDSRGLTNGGGAAGVGSGPGVTDLIDTAASPHVPADNTMGTILLSAQGSTVPASQNVGMATAGGDALTRSTVIHMEELDMVQSTLRAQMPLLVASMQGSISNARVEAAIAAAAVSMNRTRGSFLTTPNHSFGADHGDLAQLELHNQLGHGGCAVVFKGTLGTLDCAIKLMEMPDVDGQDATESPKADAAVDCLGGGGDADAGGASGDEANKSEGDGDGDGETGPGLAARRALLRNAMELAAMTTISHPNIMQVYSTFSNVTLGRRGMPDGTDHFFLKPVDDTIITAPDAPPICAAIVCEWCDKGCLATALHKRTFPAVLTSSKKLLGVGSVGSVRPSRSLDFKGILMTLLDVAMALRHLHSHHLIHRDVKPANVLLKSNVTDPRGFTAKLADFGFVTLLNQPGDETSAGEPFAYVDDTCGTVTHMAPECWQKPARLDANADVYSFGILMWEMTAGGSRPYPEVHPNNIGRLVKRGMRPTFDESIPVRYRFLAQRCWTAEPTSRPRTPELVTAISQLLGRLQ